MPLQTALKNVHTHATARGQHCIHKGILFSRTPTWIWEGRHHIHHCIALLILSRATCGKNVCCAKRFPLVSSAHKGSFSSCPTDGSSGRPPMSPELRSPPHVPPSFLCQKMWFNVLRNSRRCHHQGCTLHDKKQTHFSESVSTPSILVSCSTYVCRPPWPGALQRLQVIIVPAMADVPPPPAP